MREMAKSGYINTLLPKCQPAPVLVNKVLLEHSRVACGSFHVTIAGLSHCNRDCTASRV